METEINSGFHAISEESRISRKFFSILTEKGYTQTAICEQLSISKAKLSRWKNGKGTITIAELCELCEKLGIKPGDLVTDKGEDSSNELHYLIKQNKNLTENPNDDIFKNYYGIYHCYFHTTLESDREKFIKSTLTLANKNRKAYASMEIHLKNQHRKNKFYEGVFLINQERRSVYCVLQGKKSGEISFINFKYIPLPEDDTFYNGGMAAVITTSAGAKFLPTFHKMLISRKILNESEKSILFPYLLLHTQVLEIEKGKFEEVMKKFENKNPISKMLNRIKASCETDDHSIYRFDQTLITNDISVEDRKAKRECMSILLSNSISSYNVKIDDISADLINDVLQSATYEKQNATY